MTGKRLSSEDRASTRHAAVELYRNGATVRTVAATLAISYGLAHRLLSEASVVMAPRGGRRKT